tara:strand:- start:151 stop:822 length:672 start_codon:yes stop_codon:yes gene_type:complete
LEYDIAYFITNIHKNGIFMSIQNKIEPEEKVLKPTREEAEEAVRTLICWTGDNPDREGLIETPKRVVKAYEEFFEGYEIDPEEVLTKTFEEVQGYDDAVIVRNIRVESHCEHHIVPILGVAHVGYIPNNRVVGISKLARVVEIFGKRLQTQETMTAQIADTIQKVLQPKGVAVVVDASHQCMTTRGIHKTESSTITSRMLGAFRDNPETRGEFMNLINSPKDF